MGAQARWRVAGGQATLGIALALVVALVVDRWVLPLSDVPVLYAIPSLLAARRFGSRAVCGIAVAVLVLFVANSLSSPAPASGVWPLGAGALLVVGYLAYLLARQREETARRAAQQAAVAVLGQQALVGHDTASIFKEAVHLVAEMMHARYAAVFEPTPDDEQLVSRAGAGFPPELLGRAIEPDGPTCLLDVALRSTEPALASDLRVDPLYRGPALLREIGVVGGVSVAIHGRERTHGVLAAFSDAPRTVDDDDVSFLRTVANVLAATVDRLDAEGELARLLERERAARAEAECAVRGRDEFLSVAAHELKTPVTSLRGFAQLAARQLDATGGTQPPLVRQALDVIDRQSGRLTSLVARLLDISRIEAGRLVLEASPSDVTDLVAGVLAGARARTSRHTIELHAPGPSWRTSIRRGSSRSSRTWSRTRSSTARRAARSSCLCARRRRRSRWRCVTTASGSRRSIMLGSSTATTRPISSARMAAWGWGRTSAVRLSSCTAASRGPSFPKTAARASSCQSRSASEMRPPRTFR